MSTYYRLRLVRLPGDSDRRTSLFLCALFEAGRLDLEPGQFVEGTEEELVRAHPGSKYPNLARASVHDELLLAEWVEVERQRATGAWEPVSLWRLNELRRAADLAAVMTAPSSPPPSEIDAAIKDMRRIIAACERKPGMGEEARHLMDHVGFKADQTLEALQRIEGRNDIDREALRGILKNGRKRAGCRFCPQ